MAILRAFCSVMIVCACVGNRQHKHKHKRNVFAFITVKFKLTYMTFEGFISRLKFNVYRSFSHGFAVYAYYNGIFTCFGYRITENVASHDVYIRFIMNLSPIKQDRNANVA